MKRLALLRHAKSSWSNPKLSDHDRPLNGRGRRTAPLIAERFARHELGRPDRIVSSTALRSLVTANHLALALAERAWHAPVEVRPELYEAAPERHLELVRALNDGLSYVVLVGHNPGLEQFARSLDQRGHVDRLPTAAIVVFEFASAHWSDVAPGRGRRLLYWLPKEVLFR